MKVKKSCFVPICQNNTETTPNKLFISVPRDERREKWYAAVETQFVPKKSHIYCCEDHFNLENDAENWIEYKTIGTRLRMKQDVVPHKFIHSPVQSEKFMKMSQVSSSAKKRKLSALKSLGEKAVKRFFQEDASSSHQIMPSMQPSPEMKRMIPSPSGTFEEIESLYYTSQSTVTSKSVQVNIKTKTMNAGTSTEKVCCVSKHTSITSDFYTEEHQLQRNQNDSDNSGQEKSSTSSDWSIGGSTSGSTATWMSEKVYRQKYSNIHLKIIEKNSRLYLGLPKDAYFIVRMLEASVPIRYQEILMILKKIRLDDSNARLADDFGVSEAFIGRIFNKKVPVLAAYFNKLIFWPSTEHIEEMLPVPFRYRYRKLQSILDCLEMEIQIPTDPVKQALTWSNYKHCNTVKYLISATPHGFINFISPGYGGRTSDKTILEQCGYFDVLRPNCQIMVDRGFKQIAQALEAKHCDVVRPPTVSVNKKPTREEVQETRRIAALRIHIERTIRRLREFRMLRRHACINNDYLYLYNYIVIIACGIVNMQGLIIN